MDDKCVLLKTKCVVSLFDLTLLSPKSLDSNCGAETQIFDSHHVVIFKCCEHPPKHIYEKFEGNRKWSQKKVI